MDRGRSYYSRHELTRQSQRKKLNSLTVSSPPFDCSSWNDVATASTTAASISQPDHDYFSRHHVRNQSDAFRFRGRNLSSATSTATAAAAASATAANKPKLIGGFADKTENAASASSSSTTSCSSGAEWPRHPSYPYKRLLDDNDSSHRKIFASAEKMAEKMSRLKIANECDETGNTNGPEQLKRLYFNTDIDAIQPMSMMLPDLVLQTTNSIDNSRALILWQPTLLQNIYDRNANECGSNSDRKTNWYYGNGHNDDNDDDDDDDDDVFVDDSSSMSYD